MLKLSLKRLSNFFSVLCITVDKCGAPVIIPTTPTTTQKPTATSTQKPKESHVVAIAVGCSLAGLVLIVLIGYLIGRRRSRNASQGYRQL